MKDPLAKRVFSNRAGMVVVLILLLILLVFFGLFIDRSRLDARRNLSIENLTSIVFASHNYESSFGRFPSASLPFRPDWPNTPNHGWEVRILPFLEGNSNDMPFNPTFEWDHPDNQRAFYPSFQTVFQSPHCQVEADDAGFKLVHYAATLETIPIGKGKSREELDGHKAMFGEVAVGFFPWAKPGNARMIGNGIQFDEQSFGNPEYNGGCFAFVDGSVRYQLID